LPAGSLVIQSFVSSWLNSFWRAARRHTQCVKRRKRFIAVAVLSGGAQPRDKSFWFFFSKKNGLLRAF
jgi:hypothetical protein